MGKKLYAKDIVVDSGNEKSKTMLAQEAARKWWLAEVSDAKRFLEVRHKERSGFHGNGETSEGIILASQRPSLAQVKKAIEDAELMIMETV